jgi:hypothetical protein
MEKSADYPEPFMLRALPSLDIRGNAKTGKRRLATGNESEKAKGGECICLVTK